MGKNVIQASSSWLTVATRLRWATRSAVMRLSVTLIDPRRCCEERRDRNTVNKCKLSWHKHTHLSLVFRGRSRQKVGEGRTRTEHGDLDVAAELLSSQSLEVTLWGVKKARVYGE